MTVPAKSLQIVAERVLSERIIDPEHLRIAAGLADQFGVTGALHPDDFIYWYEHRVAPDDNKARAPEAYMIGGRDTASKLADILRTHAPSRSDFSLLEFASGYGRVSRFLADAVPAAEVTASDIHAGAVAFLNSIGIAAFQSASRPEDFVAPRAYDVIFALSFFTHMPKVTWGRWIRQLASCLEPDGLLIFTTHGAHLWPLLGRPELDRQGFWFIPDSEQKDIDVQEYGNTCTLPDFVMTQIADLPVRLEGFRAPGIGIQDLWVLRAIPRELVPVRQAPPAEPVTPTSKRADPLNRLWRKVRRLIR